MCWRQEDNALGRCPSVCVSGVGCQLRREPTYTHPGEPLLSFRKGFHTQPTHVLDSLIFRTASSCTPSTCHFGPRSPTGQWTGGQTSFVDRRAWILPQGQRAANRLRPLFSRISCTEIACARCSSASVRRFDALPTSMAARTPDSGRRTSTGKTRWAPAPAIAAIRSPPGPLHAGGGCQAAEA
jgi:hypothetical protein